MANQELLDLIVKAMQDEKHDRKKYKSMLTMTKKVKIRNQIKSAYEDEGKHYAMFRHLYFELTGEDIDVPTPMVKLAKTLTGNIKTSINGELDAVEMYRQIYSLLQDPDERNMVFEIITDEQEHATRFVYIYTKLK